MRGDGGVRRGRGSGEFGKSDLGNCHRGCEWDEVWRRGERDFAAFQFGALKSGNCF